MIGRFLEESKKGKIIKLIRESAGYFFGDMRLCSPKTFRLQTTETTRSLDMGTLKFNLVPRISLLAFVLGTKLGPYFLLLSLMQYTRYL